MKYKPLVLTKLENIDNNLSRLNSLLSQPNLTKEKLDEWLDHVRGKIEEVRTLINSEQETF